MNEENKGREYMNCNQCGILFEIPDHPERRRFCSHGCFNLWQRDENHHEFKKDGTSYRSLHYWIKRRLIKPNACPSCGKITQLLDIANISQEYKRDINDWEWLCRKCHQIKDGRWLKFRMNRKNFRKEEIYGR